jgi:hypothetical protein
MRQTRNAYKLFVGKYEGRDQLDDHNINGSILTASYRHRVVCCIVHWIDLAKNMDQ